MAIATINIHHHRQITSNLLAIYIQNPHQTQLFHRVSHSSGPSPLQFEWMASTLPKLDKQFSKVLGKKEKNYRLKRTIHEDPAQQWSESLEKLQTPLSF